MKKCQKIFSYIVFYGALLLIVAASVFFFLQKKSGQPIFFLGRSFMWVETGSMQPTIPEKSYILTREMEDADPQVGDIIVFLCRDSSSEIYGSYVTHRITAQADGGYKTKGDSPLSMEDPWTVDRADILAVYQRNLQAMTALGRLFSTPMGMVAVFALFFAVCGFVFIPSAVETIHQDEPVELTAEEVDDLVKKEVERLEKEGFSPQKDRGKTDQ